MAINGVAAVLKIKDETQTVETLEIQDGSAVTLKALASGNWELILDGFYVTVSDENSGGGTDTGGGGTDTGGGGTDTGGGGTDTGGGGTDTGGGGTDTGGSGTDTGGGTNTDGYCAGNDDTLADCDPDRNFDPWIAGTGETPYWIRNKLTKVFPASVPARTDADASRIWYGYFMITSAENKRDPGGDYFHAWISETPNGAVLGGSKYCEFWSTTGRGQFYWTQDQALARQGACYLGLEAKTVYVNFETRCNAGSYKGSGTCDDDNKQKSSRTYQFDLSRRFKLY